MITRNESTRFKNMRIIMMKSKKKDEGEKA